jgi:cell division protein FtsA
MPDQQIDSNEMSKIIAKVQSIALKKTRQEIDFETNQDDLDVRLINASIVDVNIDGYRVNNPIGFRGRDVSIEVFNCFAPMVHLGAIQTVANYLDLNLLSVVAEPFAVAKSVMHNDDNEFSAIFIDVGGGTTDIALVTDGGIVGTKMFAIGGRSFTKRIAQDLGVGFEEAERMKIKYSHKQLPEGEMKKIREALAGDIDVWISGVELALSEFSDLEILPSRILLCGGGSNLPEIRKTLESAAWRKSLPFSKQPQVHFMKPSDVANIADATGKLESVQDVTPMGLANLALDLAGEETLTQTILRRVVKLMQT